MDTAVGSMKYIKSLHTLTSCMFLVLQVLVTWAPHAFAICTPALPTPPLPP